MVIPEGEIASELTEPLSRNRRVARARGRDLLRFVGIWTTDEADEMRRLIEDERARADPNAG